jgi:membrane fusion protein (multidrug efflux system)
MPVNDREPAASQNGQQPEQPGTQEGQQNQPQNGKQESVKPSGQQDKNDKPDPDNKQDTDKTEAEKKPLDPATKRKRILIGVVVGIVLLIAGIAWWLHSRTYEATDDAQIDGHLNPIASRVAGTVKAVYVENDQPVKAGMPLVDLDPRDYEVQVEQSRAQYQQALAQLAAENPNVPITETSTHTAVDTDSATVLNAEAAVASAEYDYDSNVAKLRQAEAINRKSQSDLLRYKELVDKHEISLSDYDQYLANASSQQAAVEASRAAAASSQKVVDERRAQLLQQQNKLQEDTQNAPRQVAIRQANNKSSAASAAAAKAQLDTALLNLSYCHIFAPVDGIATERSAEVGGRISVGQQLVVIVQTENIWATADFKETQLRKMHVGQRATIEVDSLDESFEGQVEYMPAATGDRTSLFPPEDATGNYVKVVQRLPVRISLNPHQRDLNRLRPGMSIEATVHLDAKVSKNSKSAANSASSNAAH